MHEEADLSPFDPNDSRGGRQDESEPDHEHDGPGVSCAHQWYKKPNNGENSQLWFLNLAIFEYE